MSNEELEFNHIMERLEQKAAEDGKVSTEEEEFISSLRNDVEDYQRALAEAKLDDFISDDEFHELVILRDNILNRAMEFSTESKGVNVLVEELFREINKHELPGMIDDEKMDSEIEPFDQDE